MTIRKRLFLSYLAMLFIPIILFIITGILIQPYLDDGEYPHNYSSLLDQSVYNQLTYLKMTKTKIQNNPELIYDEDFWSVFEESLLIKSKVNWRIDGIRRPIFLAIIILFFTNSFLTYLVSRSITNPLLTLKMAAERIKEGDLDNKLDINRKDEFKPVMNAFEEMRIRLKKSLNQQIQYEENRKELISHISHDLRTPITAIKGYVEGINDGIADTPEKIKDYLDTIYSKSVLIDRLIDQLSLFSRLDLKQVTFHFKELDLILFIKEIANEAKKDFQNINISLILPKIVELKVQADPIHLKRVFFNLLENSIKYNNSDKLEISINVIVENNEITIKLADNGPGITQKDLPHIFEKFYRTDPSRSSQVSGSGLGLAIAKQIITAHKGIIWAENIKMPATGLQICFTLLPAKDNI